MGDDLAEMASVRVRGPMVFSIRFDRVICDPGDEGD